MMSDSRSSGGNASPGELADESTNLTPKGPDTPKGGVRKGICCALTAKEYERPHRTSCCQWVPTDAEQLENAEARMLLRIAPLLEQENVCGLNTIKTLTKKKGAEKDRHILLVHGFGGGVGNWVTTWRSLVPYGNVYAVDLPGFGRSVRPKNLKFKSADQAISFMTDSLHQWVVAMGLDKLPNGGKIDIVGHSFGSYVSANFAMKYPALVNHLVLSDPWGVNPKYERKLPWKFRFALWLFYTGNPLSVLRAFGPCGKDLLPKLRTDFADRWRPHIDDVMWFYDYTYHCNAQSPPVGEQCFQACCEGAVAAQQPLVQTVPMNLDKSINLGVIYGENTWMKTESGEQMFDQVKSNGGKCFCHGIRYISGAGHQVMSDNADEYNQVLLQMLDLTPS